MSALALAACAASAPDHASPANSEDDKPELALLTSLPMLFGEGFDLSASGSPMLNAIEQDWAVTPIAIADAPSLEDHEILLMAHPPVQTAEALVDLDSWVRGGGKLLLLADPKLDWESSLPLGDRRRPPMRFEDTGLLGHWGVTLAGPLEEGATMNAQDGVQWTSVSAGSLEATACDHLFGAQIIECDIGEGRAIIVADADWVMLGEDGGNIGDPAANHAFMRQLLARLAD